MSLVAEPEHSTEPVGVPRPRPFELFGEMGLVGVLVLVACLPAVTWLAALAAGVAHMRRHLSGYGDRTADFITLLRAALPGSWALGAGGVLVAGLIWANVGWLSSGTVPGGTALVAASVAVGALAWSVLVRAAASWSTRDGDGRALGLSAWWDLLRASARTSAEDPVGTLLLVVALGVGVLLVWMFLPLAIVVPGLWVLAAVAVEYRRAARAAS